MPPFRGLGLMDSRRFGNPSAVVTVDEDRWLAAFHRGDRAAIEQCYREHIGAALAAVGRLLGGADAETVVHEVFFRVVSDDELRKKFRGGNLGAWLAQVAVNAALDHLRRYGRERPDAAGDVDALEARAKARRSEDELVAKDLIERFRRERLPADYGPVFETRFLRRLSQREAAAELGMRRSTLAYQEQRIRELLRRFLLRAEVP